MTDISSERRRWFQFRLHTLLIAVLVLSLPLSWFALMLRRARTQKETVEVIRRLGGHVCYDWEIETQGNPFEPIPPRPHRVPAWLRNSLGDDFSDEVASVSFYGQPVQDTDLERLKVFKDLKILYLTESHITDSGLEYVAFLSKLERLELESTCITDVGLQHINQLANLRILNLGSTKITDAGLKHLEVMTNLEELSLRNTEITDAGLKSIGALAGLKTLELQRTRISDAGLVYLNGLVELQLLQLYSNSDVTEHGVRTLRHRLPNCRVGYRDPPSLQGISDNPFE